MRSQAAISVICLGVTATVFIQGLPHMFKSRKNPSESLPQPAVTQPSPSEIADQSDQPDQGVDPTSIYQQASSSGFTLLINPKVLQHPKEAAVMRQELDSQLAAIARVVPAQPLAALRKVRIWVEWKKRANGAAEFHLSADWLRQNGYNPEKAGCVEVANTQNFVQWSRAEQPWMMLHELAHAYHFLVLGDQHTGIQAAYQHAVEQKLYESVTYIRGNRQKAYALTNYKEYFAELSESYFGQNDFYPFTRTDLKTYDPVGYQLMVQTWGEQ